MHTAQNDKQRWRKAALTLISFHLKMREAFSLLTLSAWIKLMWGDAAGTPGVIWRWRSGQRVQRRAVMKGIECEETVIWKHLNDLAAGLFCPDFFSVSLGSPFIHAYWYTFWDKCHTPKALPSWAPALDPIHAYGISVTCQKSVEIYIMICRIVSAKMDAMVTVLVIIFFGLIILCFTVTEGKQFK